MELSEIDEIIADKITGPKGLSKSSLCLSLVKVFSRQWVNLALLLLFLRNPDPTHSQRNPTSVPGLECLSKH